MITICYGKLCNCSRIYERSTTKRERQMGYSWQMVGSCGSLVASMLDCHSGDHDQAMGSISDWSTSEKYMLTWVPGCTQHTLGIRKTGKVKAISVTSTTSTLKITYGCLHHMPHIPTVWKLNFFFLSDSWTHAADLINLWTCGGISNLWTCGGISQICELVMDVSFYWFRFTQSLL